MRGVEDVQALAWRFQMIKAVIKGIIDAEEFGQDVSLPDAGEAGHAGIILRERHVRVAQPLAAVVDRHGPLPRSSQRFGESFMQETVGVNVEIKKTRTEC